MNTSAYWKISGGKIDILIGTQMLAKGLDNPNVTLVGVINADNGFNLPDFRSCERGFQLLTQVAGRAGRGDNPGEVYFQTYNPDFFGLETGKTTRITRVFTIQKSKPAKTLITRLSARLSA